MSPRKSRTGGLASFKSTPPLLIAQTRASRRFRRFRSLFTRTLVNLTDYDTNYAFVRHVLSMDTTFPGNALLYRRITSPVLWQAGYALIIVGEGLSGIALAVAAISLAWRLRSDSVRFNHAKRFLIIGAALGFLVWFFGFMVVGGEWFSMWQSPTWNGQQAAFRFLSRPSTSRCASLPTR